MDTSDNDNKTMNRRQFLQYTAIKIAVCTVGVSIYSLIEPEVAAAGDCWIPDGVGLDWEKQETVVINAVTADSPADHAGLQKGDILLHWGDDSGFCLNQYGKAGEPAPITILRGDQKLVAKVKLKLVRAKVQDTGGTGYTGSTNCGYCIKCVSGTSSYCIGCTGSSCTGICTRCTGSCTGSCTSCTGCTHCTSGCTFGCTIGTSNRRY